MTARTLEEIEAISCGITYMSGHETYVCDPGEPCRKCLKRRVRAAVAIAQEQRAEGAAKDKKILALRAESKMKDDTIQKIERQLQEANECRDPAYFAQIGRKRR